MATVTGIDGVFFVSNAEENPLSSWYETRPGIRLEEWDATILTGGWWS